MKTTAAVLRELQDYYASLEIKPKHGDIAREAKLPKATITRYLNGTTKGGDLERVRAICIALEREDLVAKLPARPDIKTTMDVWDLLKEQKLADRESNLEEIGYERKLREESETRLLNEIELLVKRMERLEEDKQSLKVANAQLNNQMETDRKKHKRNIVFLAASCVCNVLLLVGMCYCLYLI